MQERGQNTKAELGTGLVPVSGRIDGRLDGLGDLVACLLGNRAENKL
jgi:hypothetical protein